MGFGWSQLWQSKGNEPRELGHGPHTRLNDRAPTSGLQSVLQMTLLFCNTSFPGQYFYFFVTHSGRYWKNPFIRTSVSLVEWSTDLTNMRFHVCLFVFKGNISTTTCPQARKALIIDFIRVQHRAGNLAPHLWKLMKSNFILRLCQLLMDEFQPHTMGIMSKSF